MSKERKKDARCMEYQVLEKLEKVYAPDSPGCGHVMGTITTKVTPGGVFFARQK